MKISELIIKLSEMAEEHGDINVYSMGEWADPVESVSFWPAVHDGLDKHSDLVLLE